MTPTQRVLSGLTVFMCLEVEVCLDEIKRKEERDKGRMRVSIDDTLEPAQTGRELKEWRFRLNCRT